MARSKRLFHYALYGSGPTLLIADLSDPATPQVVGEVVLPGEVRGIAVSGDVAYIADDAEGLRVVDVATVAAPIEIGVFNTPGNVLGVAVSGGYA